MGMGVPINVTSIVGYYLEEKKSFALLLGYLYFFSSLKRKIFFLI